MRRDHYTMTEPCSACPFRTDITFYLTPERVDEITSIDADFMCHKTTEVGGANKGQERVCAGSMIMREKNGIPNQMLRIAERLGFYDHTKLNMDSPIYEDADDMYEAMRELQRR